MDIPTQYCEYISLIGINEPFNVFTSLFFIVFSVLAYKNTKLVLLPTLLGFIGVGSGLWHLTALPWADLLDTLSIALFSIVVIYLFLLKILKHKLLTIFTILTSLILAFFLERSTVLNGSLVYIFMFFILTTLGLIYMKQLPAYRQNIKYALLSFLVAIILRIFDPIICEYFFNGSHFLWHVLMAFTGYYLILALSKKAKF